SLSLSLTSGAQRDYGYVPLAVPYDMVFESGSVRDVFLCGLSCRALTLICPSLLLAKIHSMSALIRLDIPESRRLVSISVTGAMHNFNDLSLPSSVTSDNIDVAESVAHSVYEDEGTEREREAEQMAYMAEREREMAERERELAEGEEESEEVEEEPEMYIPPVPQVHNIAGVSQTVNPLRQLQMQRAYQAAIERERDLREEERERKAAAKRKRQRRRERERRKFEIERESMAREMSVQSMSRASASQSLPLPVSREDMKREREREREREGVVLHDAVFEGCPRLSPPHLLRVLTDSAPKLRHFTYRLINSDPCWYDPGTMGSKQPSLDYPERMQGLITFIVDVVLPSHRTPSQMASAVLRHACPPHCAAPAAVTDGTHNEVAHLSFLVQMPDAESLEDNKYVEANDLSMPCDGILKESVGRAIIRQQGPDHVSTFIRLVPRSLSNQMDRAQGEAGLVLLALDRDGLYNMSCLQLAWPEESRVRLASISGSAIKEIYLGCPLSVSQTSTTPSAQEDTLSTSASPLPGFDSRPAPSTSGHSGALSFCDVPALTSLGIGA
ncbi:hypothetical protein KIPB_008459, partial [Kipferlia bialata]